MIEINYWLRVVLKSQVVFATADFNAGVALFVKSILANEKGARGIELRVFSSSIHGHCVSDDATAGASCRSESENGEEGEGCGGFGGGMHFG
jgi:hypothetical protein